MPYAGSYTSDGAYLYIHMWGLQRCRCHRCPKNLQNLTWRWWWRWWWCTQPALVAALFHHTSRWLLGLNVAECSFHFLVVMAAAGKRMLHTRRGLHMHQGEGTEVSGGAVPTNIGCRHKLLRWYALVRHSAPNTLIAKGQCETPPINSVK